MLGMYPESCCQKACSSNSETCYKVGRKSFGGNISKDNPNLYWFNACTAKLSELSKYLNVQ